mgnify:CR=1 FL=1
MLPTHTGERSMWPSLCYNNTLYDFKIYKNSGIIIFKLSMHLLQQQYINIRRR